MVNNAIIFCALLCAGTQAIADEGHQIPSNWKGPYAGVSGGYASSDFKATGDAIAAVAGDLNQHARGWTAGLLAGYNFQQKDWIYGLELNASLADVKGSTNNVLPFSLPGVNGGAPFNLYQTQSSKLDNLFSARLRLGHQFGPLMVFTAGGIAGAHAKTAFSVQSQFGNIFSVDKRFHTGYTIGAGLEYKQSSKISTRLEYAYYDLGKQNHQGIPFLFNQQVVRVGIVYHFAQ